jgi:hypothetical protein
LEFGFLETISPLFYFILFYILFYFLLFVALGIKPKASCLLGKSGITKTHPQASHLFYF